LGCFFFLIEDKGANPKKGRITMLGVGRPIREKNGLPAYRLTGIKGLDLGSPPSRQNPVLQYRWIFFQKIVTTV
jgi:hypothetical protein